jgi:proteic killer suppression protein
MSEQSGCRPLGASDLFAELQQAAGLALEKILLALNTATAPQAMNIPGLRFHALKGRDKGRYAVWASGNYRITFGWEGEDAINIDLEDYH